MNKSAPLVSILIPVYNREKIIAETIECAINQTYKNIEIIISDNCSTDATWSILQEYSNKDGRIKIFKNDINVGPVLNWKACIDKIQGEYTKILWSDDLISLDFIEKAIQLFDEETAFVMSGIKIFNSVDNSSISVSKFQRKSVYTKDEYLRNILLFNTKGFPVSPGCALFRTSDIREAYHEQIPNLEGLDFKRFGAGNDLLFFLITARKYKYVRTINQISSFFRAHPSSFTISNNLDIYYEYAMAFFVNTYYEIFNSDYKSKIYLYKTQKKQYSILYTTLKTPLLYTPLILNFSKLKLQTIKVKLAFIKNKIVKLIKKS